MPGEMEQERAAKVLDRGGQPEPEPFMNRFFLQVCLFVGLVAASSAYLAIPYLASP
jgi:hypothetical protein